jgi:excisionase family DNA binding protein
MITQNDVPKRLYTMSEAAQYLGRTVWGVRSLIWSKKLSVVKTGRTQYIDIKELDDFIRRNTIRR